VYSKAPRYRGKIDVGVGKRRPDMRIFDAAAAPCSHRGQVHVFSILGTAKHDRNPARGATPCRLSIIRERRPGQISRARYEISPSPLHYGGGLGCFSHSSARNTGVALGRRSGTPGEHKFRRRAQRRNCSGCPITKSDVRASTPARTRQEKLAAVFAHRQSISVVLNRRLHRSFVSTHRSRQMVSERRFGASA